MKEGGVYIEKGTCLRDAAGKWRGGLNICINENGANSNVSIPPFL